MKWLLALAALPLAAQVHEQCRACHSDQFEEFQQHKHFTAKLSCDICHGSSEKHRTASGAAPVDRVAASFEQPAVCGTCHAAQAKQYIASRHGVVTMAKSETRAAACTTCHGVHSLRTAALRLNQCQRCHASMKPAHPKVEGKADCFSCHSPHSLVAKK